MIELRSLILFLLLACMAVNGQEGKTPLTGRQIEAVKIAIVDEIYDYDYQGRYVDIGTPVTNGYRIALYVRPYLQGGSGQVIYKLPTGEVARVFEFKGDIAVLVREPRDKFPPTSSSTLTLYLNDDEICANKQNWIRESLTIVSSPSAAEVRDAVSRQRNRKGSSQHDEKERSKGHR